MAETAPTSGSSPIPVTTTCCYCFRGDNGACRTTAPPSSITERQHPDSLTVRRLPCGHSAHDDCLIPILLEGIGGGDPANCVCPIDSSPLFPVLSRHRRRRRDPIIDPIQHDPEEASNDSRRQGGASALVSATSDQAEAEKVTAISRHAKANVLREAVQRRGGMVSGSGGGTSDILGLTLIGSGLALVTPPVTFGKDTSPSTISEGVNGVRTISVPESRSSRYLLEGSRGKSAEKMKGISGHRKGNKNNAGILDQTQSVGGSRIPDTDEIGGVQGMICSISKGDRPSEDNRHPRGRSTGIIRGKKTGIHRDSISLA